MLYEIYTLIDPRTSFPFYVGFTNDTLRRTKEHIRDCDKKGNWRKNNILRTLKSLGYSADEIVTVEHQADTIEDAWALEVSTIAKYGRIDLGTGILTNMTEGGTGGTEMVGDKNPMYGKPSPFRGRTHSDKVKEKLSGDKKQHWDGKTHAEFFGEETSKRLLDNLRTIRKGTKHSEETKAKIGKANSRPRTEEQNKALSKSLYENPTNFHSYRLVSPEGIEYFTKTGLAALGRELGFTKDQTKALQKLVRQGLKTAPTKRSIVYGWTVQKLD